MERLLELLEKFEKLDRQLKKYYWEYHNNIEEIFNNYGLVRKYKALFEFSLTPTGPEGESIRKERERKKEKLKKEIDEKGISLDKDHHIINLIKEIISLRNDIKKFLFWYSIVIANNNITDKLKKIRSDKGYFIDEIYSKFRNVDYPTEIYSGHTEAYELFDAGDFLKRAVKIGAFVVQEDLPFALPYHILNLKECFAYGLYEACIFYCRALIESAGYEFLKQKNEIPKHLSPWDIKLKRDILNKLEKIITEKIIFVNIVKIAKLANKSLHHKKMYYKNVTEQEAFDSIKTTFEFIEHLIFLRNIYK